MDVQTTTRLDGRVAIVTGAAQGLGAAFAKALAAEGARVVVTDIAACVATAAAIRSAGGEALDVGSDVTSAASVAALVNRTLEWAGRIDILVNNAAVSGHLRLTPFLEIDTAEWDRVMAVNARGPFECMRAVVPAMKAVGGGSIINLASGTAIKGSPGLLHYVASKGAVISMTRAAARELGADNIRVNCIAPGLTMSENTRANPSWTDDVLATNLASRALKREAEPQDLIGGLLFLASSESAFVTGQTLSIDGGSVMN